MRCRRNKRTMFDGSASQKVLSVHESLTHVDALSWEGTSYAFGTFGFSIIFQICRKKKLKNTMEGISKGVEGDGCERNSKKAGFYQEGRACLPRMFDIVVLTFSRFEGTRNAELM